MDLDLFEVTNVEPRHRAIAERAGLWDAVEEILGRPVPEYEAMESTPGFCRWDGKPLPHLFEVETKRGRKPSYCPPPDDPQEKSCELQWRTRDRRQRRTHDTAVRADLHLRVVDAIIYLDRELVPVLEAIEPDAVPEGRTFLSSRGRSRCWRRRRIRRNCPGSVTRFLVSLRVGRWMGSTTGRRNMT
jgi:hypothetical protein